MGSKLHVDLMDENFRAILTSPTLLRSYKGLVKLRSSFECSGVYAWYFRKRPGKAPRRNCLYTRTGILPLRKTWYMMYIGRSGSAGLADRVIDCHYDGILAHGKSMSTLRMSLAVLLGYKLIRCGDDDYNLSPRDNKKLSRWMKAYTRVLLIECVNYDVVEKQLINRYQPPLNLEHSDHLFMQRLKALRQQARSKAKMS